VLNCADAVAKHLANAGIPGFSGFFSKDEILWQAFSNPLHGNVNMLIWGLGACAALLTAFYMFRLVFMTFHGTCRIKPGAEKALHESPFVIVFPLIVLAILSIVGGYIGLPKLIGDLVGGVPNYLEHYLSPVFANANEYMHAHAHHGEHSHSLEWGLMGVSVVIALVGITIAYMLYIVNPEIPRKFTNAFPGLHRAVYNKWYIDELYDFIFIKSL
jgi:NADH-quinone oxidoreductase subunit L